jgi:hypothetical protein
VAGISGISIEMQEALHFFFQRINVGHSSALKFKEED